MFLQYFFIDNTDSKLSKVIKQVAYFIQQLTYNYWHFRGMLKN